MHQLSVSWLTNQLVSNDLYTVCCICHESVVHTEEPNYKPLREWLLENQKTDPLDEVWLSHISQPCCLVSLLLFLNRTAMLEVFHSFHHLLSSETRKSLSPIVLEEQRPPPVSYCKAVQQVSLQIGTGGSRWKMQCRDCWTGLPVMLLFLF